ncbi:hypothetical protein [Crossiella cryophila]|uniref:Uncharacterized protein n=1 Tax=Crossiella cryophila TaxID=43355 RepID=A0A7W7C7F2_9PSEU|nr:hypothetical protein [Crossiella cryophila]MBB4674599.1 hypothetical protein [Crossiella cryophila]
MKVPIGPHSPQWTTVRTERTVLAVVHNLTAATRLLDVLPLVADDPRVQVVFTCPGSSAFSGRTEEWLHEQGMAVIPWSQAIQVEFDLVLAASYGGDLRDLLGPLVVLPHGMGYNKYSPGNRKSEIGNRKSEIGFRSFAALAAFRRRAGPRTDRALARGATHPPDPGRTRGRGPHPGRR